MRRVYFRDELLDAQLLRTMGTAPYEGADLGECLAVADALGPKSQDLDRWYELWSQLGDRVAALAADEIAAGRVLTARGACFRASNYYRTAGVMLLGPGQEERLRHANRRQTETFRAGAALLEAPPEVLSVPFDGATLPGYFFPAAGDAGSRPTLVLIGGYDGTCEELYLLNGAAAVARGYNAVAVDLPGQGAALLQHGLTMSADVDRAVSAVLDAVIDRAEVDRQRVALVGLSLGAHLAPRAASVDHRVAACIADCGAYDLFAAALARMPPPLARRFDSGSRPARAVVSRALRLVERRPTAGWALRRGQLVHGAGSPLAYLLSLREFTLDGRAEHISCPTLVCFADEDDISASAPRLAAAVPDATMVRFTAAEGAGDHCEAGARLLFHARAFAWLEQVLA